MSEPLEVDAPYEAWLNSFYNNEKKTVLLFYRHKIHDCHDCSHCQPHARSLRIVETDLVRFEKHGNLHHVIVY